MLKEQTGGGRGPGRGGGKDGEIEGGRRSDPEKEEGRKAGGGEGEERKIKSIKQKGDS